jgi:hypothetical protein
MVKYSSIADLNDPHEFMPFTLESNFRQLLVEDRVKKLADIDKMKLSREEKKKLKAPIYSQCRNLQSVIDSNTSELDNQIYLELRKRREKNWGVFCLSDTWQSLVMWHFYAAAHTGVCIGWDGNCSIFQKGTTECPGNDAGFFPLRKVEYISNSEKTKVNVCTSAIDSRAFFIKHLEWSYEHEWRSIVRWDALEEGLAARSQKDASLIHMGVNSIKEIIVGTSCHPLAKQKAVKFGELHGVPVYSMALSTQHFGARRLLLGR